MKEREELELILKLIRKYDLPLSPILEYAVNEKMEEYPDMDDVAENEESIKISVQEELIEEPIQDEIVEVDDASSPVSIETMEEDKELSSASDEENFLSQDYTIENYSNRCNIIDNKGQRVFRSSGQLIRLDNEFYRVNYVYSSISMNLVQIDSDGVFVLKRCILRAPSRSPLYKDLDEQDYLKQFKAVIYDNRYNEYYVQVGERWYGSSGYYADLDGLKTIREVSDVVSDEANKQSESNNTKDCNPNETPADNDDSNLFDFEIEHVYLDSKDKIIDIKTSYEVFPGKTPSSENRKGKPWTKEEEELVKRYFNQGIEIATIAKNFGRTEVSIKMRLAKLGLIEYIYGQDDPLENEDISNSKLVGKTVQLFPSQEIGEVIGTTKDKDGNPKLIIKTNEGNRKVIYDNSFYYQIVATAKKNKEVKSNYIGEATYRKRKVVRTGDWIKTRANREKCRVMKIEKIGPYEKLILEYRDGRQDWIINNPDIYTIVD